MQVFPSCRSLLIPLMMIIAGWVLRKHPPACITASMDRWRFAQADCGRRWWRASWAMLLPSAAALLPMAGLGMDAASILSLILMTVQTLVMAIVTLRTEHALKRVFTPDGKRRSCHAYENPSRLS